MNMKELAAQMNAMTALMAKQTEQLAALSAENKRLAEAAARPVRTPDPMVIVIDRLAPSESGKPRVRARIGNTSNAPIVINPGEEVSFFVNGEFAKPIDGGTRNGFYCAPMTGERAVQPIRRPAAATPAAETPATAAPAARTDLADVKW